MLYVFNLGNRREKDQQRYQIQASTFIQHRASDRARLVCQTGGLSDATGKPTVHFYIHRLYIKYEKWDDIEKVIVALCVYSKESGFCMYATNKTTERKIGSPKSFE